ncbi:MAG TPA: translocation/assembly module TamB domain-containing protein [Chitinophagales bacterium]|nr:translocation/assembly module TamB domain-containing protein [Chitinophagales bacterium]
MKKKVYKRLLIAFLVLFLLTVSFFVAVRYPAVQTYLAQRATDILSNTLETKVSIERVEITFFDKAHFVNFYLEDHNHDTLINVGDLSIRFRLFELINKKIDIRSVSLDGGTLYLHRDSTGKKLNIAELFSKFQSNKQAPTTKNKGFSWDINLSSLRLTNIHFRYLDEKGHMDLKVGVPSCQLAANKINIKKGVFDIEYLHLDSLNTTVDLLPRIPAPKDTTGEIHFLPEGMKVSFSELKLAGCSFKLTDHNSDTIIPNGMDFKHLDVGGINMVARNGAILGDTISTSIVSMTAKERSGFTLNNLSANAIFSANEITLDRLDIKTPKSEIKNYLSFRYSSFSDFKNFVNKVRIKARLANSHLSFADLNYFVHNLQKLSGSQLAINGELDGRVDNLKGRGIEIRTGANTIFKGDFYTRGLPDVYETSLNINVERLATTADDIRTIFKGAQLPPNLNNLGLIYYTGSVDGFLTNFASTGKLVTSIGSATTDVDFAYNRKRNKASYKGALALTEFDLGKYFNAEDLLGKVSMTSKVDGVGLTLESLHVKVDGNISSLVFKGYNYRDIKINGSVDQKSFEGMLAVRDSFLDMDFNGRADLSQKEPDFNFTANVRKASLKNLHLLKDDISISGTMNSNFNGRKFDDFIGSVNLANVTVSRDTMHSFIKKFALNARMLSSQKKEVTLVSDFVESEMSGNFNLIELPAALQEYARHTFAREKSDTITTKYKQDFTLDFRVYEPGNFLQIIYPKLSDIYRSRITCDFNSTQQKLNLTATVPEIAFAGYHIRNINIGANSDKDNFSFNASVERVYHNDSVMIDSAALAAKTVGDDIRFDLSAANQRKTNYGLLTAFVTPQKTKALVRLAPSDFILGSSEWHFGPNDSIFIDGKKITSKNLVFKSNEQTIKIDAYLKNDTSTCVKLALDNTDLGNFTKIFTNKSKEISGIVNGNLRVEDVFYTPKVFADVAVNNFVLGTEPIGDIQVSSRLDSTRKKMRVAATIKGIMGDSVRNDITAAGYVSLDPDNPGMQINFEAKRLGLNFLNYKFFDRYVKNARGYAVAKGIVYGTPKKPLLNGDVYLVNDTVTVSFLNTTYHLSNQHAILDDHGFSFPHLVINDNKGRRAFASGRINHESFRDFELDLNVNTQNPDNPAEKNAFQFLNTTEKESPNFYGVAYGYGHVYFKGPINSPRIDAYAKTSSGTYCKLPINSSYETNRYSFYKFISHGRDSASVQKDNKLKLNGVTFSLTLDVTPDARMDIILDPTTGDILTGYGYGSLKIDIPKNSNLTLYGNYEVERGSYLFTLQNIINKRLELDKGGTVNFNGEIYKAHLNLSAVYEVRSSVTDLIDDMISSSTSQSSTGGSTSSNQLETAAQSRIPIDLILRLTGILERPTIAFDIKAVDPDPTIKSYVEQKLALLRTNESEMNKQVFGLLVMNRFIPSSSSTGSAITNSSNIGGTAANTVSEFLSSQLSNYLSNLLEFANIRNLDLNIGYRQYDQTSTLSNSTNATTNAAFDTRRELQLALSQRLLNNRLSINAGGNLDFGNSNPYDASSSGSRSVIPTGDFQIEYALTPDGAWRAKAFNRTNYDYYNARNSNRTGLGISYRQEFDKPSELIHKKQKKVKTDSNQKGNDAKKEDAPAAPPPAAQPQKQE